MTYQEYPPSGIRNLNVDDAFIHTTTRIVSPVIAIAAQIEPILGMISRSFEIESDVSIAIS